MEPGAGFKNVEAPVDAGFSFVPLQFQGMNLPAEGCLVGETLSETIAGEDTELDLSPQPSLGQAIFDQLPCLGVQ